MEEKWEVEEYMGGEWWFGCEDGKYVALGPLFPKERGTFCEEATCMEFVFSSL
jgi:hypothetical protein